MESPLRSRAEVLTHSFRAAKMAGSTVGLSARNGLFAEPERRKGATMPLEGSHISRFRLLRLLGRGGMGEVYLAEDEQLRRLVAIKILGSEVFDETASRLFLREARAIASLNHPHILPLFDFGEATLQSLTLTYMVMPFCQEDTLATWIREHRLMASLSVSLVEGIVEQAASALEYAHSQRIVHQDVKPSNFLIRSGQATRDAPDLLLADFGVAKFTGASATMSQTVRGTPAYMAPEQWEGTAVPATDQYALAILVYDLLTGHPPFQGGLGQVMYQHLHVAPSPASKSNPQLSEEVDTVLLHALEKSPEARFASISAFAHALREAFQAGASSPSLAPTSRAETKGESDLLKVRNEAQALPVAERLLPLPGGRQDAASLSADSATEQGIRPQEQARGAGEEGAAFLLTVKGAPTEEQAPFVGEEETILSSAVETPISSSSLSSGSASSAHLPEGLASAPASSTIGSALRPTHRPGLRATVLGGLACLIVVGSMIGYLAYTGINQQSPSSLYGTVALDDPLNDNSRGYGWSELSETARSCVFTQGAYHVRDLQNTTTPYCTATNQTFGDFAYQVQVTIVRGDAGGIIFREDPDLTKGNFYLFGIDQTGKYGFFVFQHYSSVKTLRSGSSLAIHAGLSQSNLLAVVASGAQIDLYVNKQKIDSVSDDTYNQGCVGVVAAYCNHPTEVVFRDAKVWR